MSRASFWSVALAVGWRNAHNFFTKPAMVVPALMFPLFFAALFLSSMALPRDLIEIGWFQTVATYNPVSYMLEGIRSLVITGWDGEAIALGFACAGGLSLIALAAASSALRTRMVRT